MTITTSTSYAETFQKFKTQSDCENIKKFIHIVGKSGQAFFGIGCCIQGLAAFGQLASIFSGNSFLYHGTLLALRVVETLVCYDLAKLSSNIASIFHSQIILASAKKYLGTGSLATITINALEKIEEVTSLPVEIQKNTKSAKNFTKALTYGTVGIQHLNPQIEKFINKT